MRQVVHSFVTKKKERNGLEVAGEVSKERADACFLFYKAREQHVCKMMGKIWP